MFNRSLHLHFDGDAADRLMDGPFVQVALGRDALNTVASGI